jgi:hypothetical protein
MQEVVDRLNELLLQYRQITISLTWSWALGALGENCCDKSVIVPCSERLRVDQNESERLSAERFNNQVE